MPETTKVKLYSGPEKTVTWIWLQEKYKSDFDIKKLLEERGIAFHKEIESWA